jgi:replicative DNA helicase
MANITIEKEVLSTLIQNKNDREILFDLIKEQGFNETFLSLSSHKEIFNCLIRLYSIYTASAKDADEAKEKNEIITANILKNISPESKTGLSNVLNATILLPAQFNDNLEYLKKEYQRVSVSNLNKQIASQLDKNQISSVDAFNIFNDKMVDIKNQNLKKIGQNAKKALEKWEKKISIGIEGMLPTGFYNLDHVLNGGIDRGNFILCSADSGIGKTSFSLDIVHNVVFKQNKRVLFCSFEMTVVEIIERLLSKMSGVSSRSLKSYKWRDNPPFPEATEKVEGAIKELKEKSNNLLFVGYEANTVKAIEGILFENNYDFDLIVIDYIGLMTDGELKNSNTNAMLSKISHELKQLTLNTEIPIFVNAQLNRSNKGKSFSPNPIKNDNTPSLWELKDSGSLENDPNVILFIYKTIEQIKTEKEHMDAHEGKVDIKNLERTLFVAKNRSGEANRKIDLLFNGYTTTFKENWKKGERHQKHFGETQKIQPEVDVSTVWQENEPLTDFDV